MNDRDYELVQALHRVKVFAAEYGGQFPADGKAAEAIARLEPLLEKLGNTDSGRGVPASPATGGKTALLEEIWEDLKGIAETARTIALDEPGFDAGFRLAAGTQRGIMAAAESFLERLEKPETARKFTSYDLPEDFVTDLKADLKAVKAFEEEQSGDRLESTGGTTQTRTLLKEGKDLLQRLNTSVRNRFQHQPEVLTEWRTASRIHRAPRAAAGHEAKDPAPPPAGHSSSPVT